MKEIVKRLEAAVKESNKIDEAWELDPENTELEKAWDAAYKTEYGIRTELANAIVKFTKQIDFETAFKMTYNSNTIELIKLADNV